MTRLKQRLLIIALCLVSAACSGMLESRQAPERVYWLKPLIVSAAQPDPGTAAGLASFAVSVTTAPGLDTDRLLILEPDARLNYYAAARWPDHNALVFAALLRRTLESSARYARVTDGASAHNSDLRLELEVRELYTLSNSTDNGTGQTATLRMLLQGHLDCAQASANSRANSRANSSVKPKAYPVTLQADIPVSDKRLGNIVAAYQKALNQTSLQLLAQTAGRCGGQ